jgi:hypothetical protein
MRIFDIANIANIAMRIFSKKDQADNTSRVQVGYKLK